MTSLVSFRLLSAGQLAAPYFAAALLMGLGYFRFLPSLQHQGDYHDFAFSTLSYSDVVWPYFRDNLATGPIPFVDYPLEYPVLLGVFSYLVSWAPGAVSYFTVTYVLMAAAGLGTIWALGQFGGTDVWRFALVPTLFFYTGLNWDLAAVLLATLALWAFRPNRDLSGAPLLTAAVWFKLFPVVLLTAVLYERYRDGRLSDALRIGAVFAAGSIAVNLHFPVANWQNWLLFFTFNRERPADAGLWAALGEVPIGRDWRRAIGRRGAPGVVRAEVRHPRLARRPTTAGVVAPS